jgi:hypothetical protein
MWLKSTPPTLNRNPQVCIDIDVDPVYNVAYSVLLVTDLVLTAHTVSTDRIVASSRSACIYSVTMEDGSPAIAKVSRTPSTTLQRELLLLHQVIDRTASAVWYYVVFT